MVMVFSVRATATATTTCFNTQPITPSKTDFTSLLDRQRKKEITSEPSTTKDRPALVQAVHVSPRQEQQVGHVVAEAVHVRTVAGVVQGRPAEPITRLEIRPSGHEQLHGVGLTVLNREVQSRSLRAIHGIDSCPELEKLLGRETEYGGGRGRRRKKQGVEKRDNERAGAGKSWEEMDNGARCLQVFGVTGARACV